MIKRYFIFSALVLSLFSLHLKRVQALEKLTFTQSYSPSLKLELNRFLHEKYNTRSDNYNIAHADLNQDGQNEHILQRTYCTTTNSGCIYIIVAENKNGFTELGTIHAKSVMPGGSFSYGVRDVLAFDNEINDYNFKIYSWSPQEKKYILESE